MSLCAPTHPSPDARGSGGTGWSPGSRSQHGSAARAHLPLPSGRPGSDTDSASRSVPDGPRTVPHCPRPLASLAFRSGPCARGLAVSVSPRIVSPARVSRWPRANGTRLSWTEKPSVLSLSTVSSGTFFFSFNLSKQPISVNQVKSNLN